MTPSSGSAKDARPPLRSLRALHENAFIPQRTSRTSAFTPSQPKSNGISLTRLPSTMLLDDTESEGEPLGRPNKRKRDSEPHSGGSSQLREAQERVEQKRAKIAARVPSAMAPGNHRPTLKKVTSLADLYARLHRDSGHEDASSAPPHTPKAVEIPKRSSSPGRSSASSPDPIALTEDDQDIVLPIARPKPVSPLINLAQLSQSLKLKASTLSPTRPNGAVTLNGVEIRELDASMRLLDVSPHPSTPIVPETPREVITILDTPFPTPPPLTPAADIIKDPTPEPGVRRSRRYLNGPLWWRQPAFEARVKADIQRTLRLLLPADPAEDPPPPIGEGAGRWRAEVRPRQPRARMWAERLEDAFGPGPLERGLGRKPRRVPARPASAARRKNGRKSTMVLVNPLSHGRAHGMLKPPSRHRSPSPSLHDTETETVEASVVFNDITNNTDVVLNANESDEAAAWTVALLPLVEHASDRGLINLSMLKESALADTVRRLGELEDVPLGDTHSLRDRARTLAERWRETFGDGLVS
ncbi:hypothetical protein EI94DRAFT_1754497 [Lactarius quietus]|nr:hypothetical protein EI94DRAFT_1754497 [Lactarius quietus]